MPSRSIIEIRNAVVAAKALMHQEAISPPKYLLPDIIHGVAEELNDGLSIMKRENIVHFLHSNPDALAAISREVGAERQFGFLGVGRNAIALSYECGGKRMVLRLTNLKEEGVPFQDSIQPTKLRTINHSVSFEVSSDTDFHDLLARKIITENEFDAFRIKAIDGYDASAPTTVTIDKFVFISHQDPAVDLEKFVENGLITKTEAERLRDHLKAEFYARGVYFADDHLGNLGITACGKFKIIDPGAIRTNEQHVKFLNRLKEEGHCAYGPEKADADAVKETARRIEAGELPRLTQPTHAARADEVLHVAAPTERVAMLAAGKLAVASEAVHGIGPAAKVIKAAGAAAFAAGAKAHVSPDPIVQAKETIKAKRPATRRLCSRQVCSLG